MSDHLIGKFEGFVVETDSSLDPNIADRKRGRILCVIPRVFGDEVKVWCDPSFSPGIFFIPHKDDKVYIEFQQGSPDHPIWVSETPKEDGDLPTPADTVDGSVRLIDTLAGQIQFKEKEGEEFIKIIDKEQNLIHFDIPNKNIIFDFKNDWNITVANDSTVNILNDKTENITNKLTRSVGGDEIVAITGKEEVITTGDYDHTAANMNFISSGSIKIGSDSATENLVLGVQFTTLFNAHMHIGNLGIPSGPPIAPMTAAQLASKVFTEA